MYAILDELIVAAIKEGKSPHYAHFPILEVIRLSSLTGREDSRVMDGRLQSLRRRGLIRYKAGKWEVCK